MKTAYVTGATGCVGRNLVDVLLKNGWRIIVLHRKSSNLKKLSGLDLVLKEVDLYDLESVRSALDQPADVLFHPAGNTSHWFGDAEAQWKDNVLATRNLVQASLEKKIGRFIFTSTGATNSYENTDKNGASRINNNYIRTKRLSELEVYKGIEKGLDAVILKPIIVLGKYDYTNYSRIFIDMKKNSINFCVPGKICFCHAEDVAIAHLRAFERGRTCESYVLGGPHASWSDLSMEIAKLMGVKNAHTLPKFVLLPFAYFLNFVSFFTRKAPLITPEVVTLLEDAPDVTFCAKRKAKMDLGYESRPLSAMVQDTYVWLEKEGVLK